MSHAIDPALERTPPQVAAMRSFKEKLLSGHKVSASQFGIVLPNSINDTHNTQETEIPVSEEFLEKSLDEEFEPLPDIREEFTLNKVQEIKDIGNKDAAQLLTEYLDTTAAREDVRIVGSFGKIGFKAVNVSVTDFGLAVIIKKDAILFEPNINTDLVINYKGKDYSVVYAGGFFTFPKMPFTFVSFLRVNN